MSGRLEGRVAIVTGGSRGIGEAIARAFAREGAQVAIASRKPDGIAAAASSINAEVPGSVLPVVCHVGQADQIAALYERVAGELGEASILVNNAGTNPYFGPMLGVQWPIWDKTFEVNLKGPFEMTRHFVQRALAAGGHGSVVNVSSVAGTRSAQLQGVYGMTKAALISMTQTLAVEMRGTGLRFNAIAPGYVDTRLAAAFVGDPALTAPYTARCAIPRVGQPEEIAGLAVYLASDESSYMTGQTVFVDGGYTIG